MAWKQAISMVVAQHIFPQFDIQPHEISGKTAYYSATVAGKRLEDQGLTSLCKRIVETLTQQQI